MDSKLWLERAREAYSQSTSYVDANYRTKWENNLRHAQNKHHAGSKYYKDSYLFKSKMFRPKTKSMLRNSEAAIVAAFFSNQDIVSIEPENPNDPMQVASAAITQEIVDYRLKKTIPWYLILLGGAQDAMITSVVCSYQSWEYEEREIDDGELEVVLDPMTGMPVVGKDGQPAFKSLKRVEKVKDRPRIELQPIENIRIHPAADWTDPIQSSPYVIRMIPMLVMDVRAKMDRIDTKTGSPKWNPLTDAQIRAASKNLYDSTRSVRDGQREDKYEGEVSEALGQYEVVWVHENFMREDGEDYVFYTMGTEHLLTEPKLLKEIYHHGERPLVMGYATIESHKIYPDSLVEIGSGLQQEINEVVNQRLDNVKLVMNKHWFVKRGNQVDLRTLTRNIAGAVTLINTPDDVRSEEFHDVTSSAYQEQDRLNVDYDETVGTFSASTIQTNRKLNETVGGMNMLRGATNSLIEYLIRTLSETWVEPVLRQLVKLEQQYESDEVILALAADKAKLFQKYGIDRLSDELLNQQLTVNVNVGMGATDPIAKVQNFMMGIDAIAKLAVVPPGLIDVGECGKEIFGRIGYKDGTRFLPGSRNDQEQPDPEKQQMAQMMQEMKRAIEELQAQVGNEQADRQTQLELENMKQTNENKRKAAELHTSLQQKQMDLENPVVGEKRGNGGA